MTSTERLSPPGGVVNEAVPALSLRGQWHCAPPSGPASPLSFLPLRTPPPPPRLLPSAQEGRRASGCRAVTEECLPRPPSRSGAQWSPVPHTGTWPSQRGHRCPRSGGRRRALETVLGLSLRLWLLLPDPASPGPKWGEPGGLCHLHLPTAPSVSNHLPCPSQPVPAQGPAVRLSHGCHHSSAPRRDLAGHPGRVPCRAAVSLGGVVPEPSVERFLHTHSACCLHGPGVGAPVCARGTVLSGPSDWCASTPPLPARTCSSALLSWAGLGQRRPQTPLHTC